MSSETGLFYSSSILKGKYVIFGDPIEDSEIRDEIKHKMTGTCVYNTNLKHPQAKKGLVIPGTKSNKSQLDAIATDKSEDHEESKSSADVMRKKKEEKEVEEEEEEKSDPSEEEDSDDEEDRMKTIEDRINEKKDEKGNESDPDSEEDDIVTLCRKVKNAKIKTRKELDKLTTQVKQLSEEISKTKKIFPKDDS